MGTTHSNARGGTKRRRARKTFLLRKFGDGLTAPCHFCQTALDCSTLTIDRIVPGAFGGGYAQTNIRPACKRCNQDDGARLQIELQAAGLRA